MKTKLLLSLTLANLLTFTASAQQTFKFGTAENPQGETILVDNKGFIINGHHVIPVMGELHYARVPEKDWRREIKKMQAGGITILSTYVFWIHHEQEQNKWDWSGNKNLRKFIETCAEEQMPVVLRIGPFCHGEVYQGGFPNWLVDLSIKDKKYKLRSTAPGFMKATTNLFNNIYAQVNGLLWKDGGPIIGLQIENECRGPWAYYEALKTQAVKTGFDLPFYTRTGWPKLNGKEVFGQMLPLYGDYADGFWDRKLTDMPGDYTKAFIMKDSRISSVIATEALGTNQDTKMETQELSYPYLTCELGGGMMTAYHRRINMSGKEMKPLAICKLGSGSNLPGYYMYHGGTNPYNKEHTMGETQDSKVTNYNDMPYMSYDFQSPLGEMGQLNETAYHESRILHQMLKDWGEELSMMDVDSLSEHYARRGSFIFRNDYVRIINENGLSYVTPYNLTCGKATINWANAEPFCKTKDITYLVEIEGKKTEMCVNGKKIKVKMNKPFKAGNETFCVLSRKKAYTAFKIDGNLIYSSHNGVIFKMDSTIVEEYWAEPSLSDNFIIKYKNIKKADSPRKVLLGKQKVATMPVEEDFERAAIYNIELKNITDKTCDDLFLKIDYKGDVARVYADNELVEDNFWNGKPMLVRVSDLIGKKIELRILPMAKDYPIYLQKEQKHILNQTIDNTLLSLDNI
nr:beta-galactosidase [Bacteroidaceae bacterium]